jgi:hypothetical protein
MVTTSANYFETRYRTSPSDGTNGVVRVSYGGSYSSGAVLFDGHAILTVAHLFAGREGSASVHFETQAGSQTSSVSRVLSHPGYDGQANNYLAIVWLTTPAPVTANRYQPYRATDEIGQSFTMVGYGRTGTGQTGMAGEPGAPVRLKASNQFDADVALLKVYLGSGMGWSPLPGTQLIADFDSGMSANDALGRLIYQAGLGLGADEGLIAPGDSGGPAFLDGKIAGVGSYTASLKSGSVTPDIDATSNSSFGEIAAWQRVSAYQQWIDQSLRARYPNPPTKPDEVKKEVSEGDSGTSYAYFLVQFNGMRTDPQQILSVDYTTRNGSALAGSDYLAISGRLNLYPDEMQAVIPVEIIGDRMPESSEVFYLDVFNPVGGSFGGGVLTLSAMRTILDNDGW